MKLIKCKKCGSAIVTEDALLERMNDTIHELTEKARNPKNKKNANSYLAEASNVTKMMKGILHNTAQMEERKVTCSLELSEIVHYLLQNNLITHEKLDELRAIARNKAKERNIQNQKELDRIYGNYKSLYTPCNKTKNDSTANKAIEALSYTSK